MGLTIYRRFFCPRALLARQWTLESSHSVQSRQGRRCPGTDRCRDSPPSWGPDVQHG